MHGAPIPAPTRPTTIRCRCSQPTVFSSYGSSLGRLFLKLSVQQLFGKLHALELQDLGVLFHSLVQRQADLPGPREDRRIFDGGLVIEVIWIRAREALHHVELAAGEITG